MRVVIKKQRRFTERDIARLRTLAPGNTSDQLAAAFGCPEPTITAVCARHDIAYKPREAKQPGRMPCHESKATRIYERGAVESVGRTTAFEVAKRVLRDRVQFGDDHNRLEVGGRMRPATVTDIMRATNRALAACGLPQVISNPNWRVYGG